MDPANRLVAPSLEKNRNLELKKLSLPTNKYQPHQNQRAAEFPSHKRIVALTKEIPALWARIPNIKDKKRIVRLLISDITVTKNRQTKTLFLNVRWQAGPLQQIQVTLPLNAADKIRYPQTMVEKVRDLIMQYGDDKKQSPYSVSIVSCEVHSSISHNYLTCTLLTSSKDTYK